MTALLTEANAGRVAEAMDIFFEGTSGNLAARARLEEALTRSDFPKLLGAGLDRQLLNEYQAAPSVAAAFTSEVKVPDFKPKNLVDLLGGRSDLDLVGEGAPYPEGALDENEYSISVAKFGKILRLTWEMIINDDLDAFASAPGRYAQAAINTIDKKATSLLCTAAGPDTNFFKVGNGNAPAAVALTADNLASAISTINARRGPDGEPILFPQLVLVVPPALEVAAHNIVKASEIEITDGGTKKIRVSNWIAGRVSVVVNPWLTTIDVTNKNGTTWYLVPSPNTARPALVRGFLKGHEAPELRLKSDGGQYAGGGTVDPLEGSFDNDDIAYRVRQVTGAAQVDPIGTYVSTGS